MAESTVKVSIYRKGVDPDELLINVNHKTKSMKTALIRLGDKTVSRMRNIIETDRSTPRDPNRQGKTHLVTGITAEKFGGGRYKDLFIGVGNISKLNKKFPYWYIVNYGGTPNFGGNYHLTGGSWTGESNSTFVYEGQDAERSYMVPSGVKGEIRPISYIQKTKSWVKKHLRDSFNREMKKERLKTKNKIKKIA